MGSGQDKRISRDIAGLGYFWTGKEGRSPAKAFHGGALITSGGGAMSAGRRIDKEEEETEQDGWK